MRSLARNLSDLTVALSRYEILLCSETLVSDMHHVSELLVPEFGRPILCPFRMPLARTGPRDGDGHGHGAFCQPKFECGCCEMLFFMICGARQNLCVQSLLQL